MSGDSANADREPAGGRPIDESGVAAKVAALLTSQFCMDLPGEFVLVVEGGTDRDYLNMAADRARRECGVELLSLPEHLCRPGKSSIDICTPGKPGMPHRGGVAQVVRLAGEIRTFVFVLEVFRAVLFVFDHDHAGLDALGQLDGMGYRRGEKAISLDPKEHPGSCASKQVVIEDLLSLRIQKQFFEFGGATCTAEYRAGNLRRFSWGDESKPGLRDFVSKNGTWGDLREIGRVLVRARKIFGFPTPDL